MSDSSSGKKPFNETASSYVSDSDLKTQCPSCYQDNTEFAGMIITDNSEAPSYICKSCNTMYVKPAEGGVRSLIDNVTMQDGSSGGFFTPASNSFTITDGTTYNTGVVDTNLDYDSKQKLDNIASEISYLSTSILSLMDELKKIAKTNEDLMEKLANDPLINVKKRINEFNLK